MTAALERTTRSVTFDTLLDWFRHEGGRLSGSVPRWDGRDSALLAQRDLESGEAVLVVPRKMILTGAAVRASVLGVRLHAGGVEEDRALFAAWLAHERRENGYWRPMLNASTQDFSYIPMMYPRARHAWLAGTQVAIDAREGWQSMRQHFRRVNDLLPRDDRVSLRDFAWGWHLYFTQIFSLGGDKPQVGMVPLGGLLQHAAHSNCAFSSDTKEFRVYTTRAVSRGELLTISFGRMHAAHFLSKYGYFPEKEHTDGAVLDIDLSGQPWLPAVMPRLTQVRTPRFFLSHNTLSAETRRLLSTLRLSTARSRDEARRLAARAGGSTYVPYTGADVERTAMAKLRDACRAALDAMPTTLQQDIELAEKGGLEPWQLQCVILRRGHKQVLTRFLQLAEKMLVLLSLPVDACRAALDSAENANEVFFRELRSALPRAGNGTNVVDFPAVHAGLNTNERKLCNWFFDQGGILSGGSVRVYDGLRGMVAVRDIAPGDVVMRVPRHLFLTDVVARQTEIGRSLAQGLHGASPEYTLVLPALIADTRRRGGHWSPMVDTFPQSYSRPESFEPAAWELLKGTEAHARAHRYWKQVRTEYRRVTRALPEPLRMSFRSFFWAHQSVSTRCFNLKIDGEWASGLIPVAEMFNHSPRPTCDWGGDSSQFFDITANQPVKAGTPLTISYGCSANTRLLAQYGFCLDNNDRETVQLRFDLGPNHWLHDFAPKLVNQDPRPGFEIGLYPMAESARQLMSLVRLMQFPDADAARAHARVQSAQLPVVPLLDRDNEIGALKRLHEECERRQRFFPETMAADEERLAQSDLSVNQRMALTYRLGQRRMVASVAQYVEQALAALTAGEGERKAALQRNIDAAGPWTPYFQELLAVA